MSDTQFREFGKNFRSLLDGLASFSGGGDQETSILAKSRDYRAVKFGSEIRSANLYTEISVGGREFTIKANGARSCSTNAFGVSEARTTGVFSLTCDLTYFAADHPELGSVKIIQDPRIETKGWIFLRRSENGDFELPGLSYFNQHLIFHIGDNFFYYPRAWQVVSAITAWPPEFHQYHHLEDDTPIFDFVSKEPNVARKGISTISIESELSPEEEKAIRADFAREVKLIKSMPASKMSPEDLTPGQVIPEQKSPARKKK